ncbi:PLDc N-terminal domain-containing protein [Paenibacillus sp.]|jgi:uncharacterized membrane protein|uniref:PLD nuclease N-terminal domain-containing protein n=1 Tax=Paenibacillus sp. TaxID=58172 RepID=UPI00282525C5|nr:PLDc N-terminal domain-containing protein [Paenibacillus sp.]MDR0268147.1 PLDc N-terminal domain-containing protein [Paenibacillus sp.]
MWIIGLAGAVLLFVMIAKISLGIWTYRDAKSRGLEARMWTLIVVLVPNFIGLLLYFLIGRKQQRASCPSCGSQTQHGRPYCSNCGAAMAQGGISLITSKNNSKKPLIITLTCVVLTFVLMIFAFVASVYTQPEMFSSKSITIGQFETRISGTWKLSFWYFNGEKSRAIKIKNGTPTALNISAEVQKGTVEMGITVDGKEERRISLNNLDSTYVWDLSSYPENSRVVLYLYGDAAKGKVNMNWND